MHPFLDHPSHKARAEIARLKEAVLLILDPQPAFLEGVPGFRGKTAGWETVKSYANELAEMLRIDAIA